MSTLSLGEEDAAESPPVVQDSPLVMLPTEVWLYIVKLSITEDTGDEEHIKLSRLIRYVWLTVDFHINFTVF